MQPFFVAAGGETQIWYILRDGRRMDGAKKIFTELENFFSAREEKAPVFLSGNSKINLKRAEDYVILCKSP